jgi:hypothetical protein
MVFTVRGRTLLRVSKSVLDFVTGLEVPRVIDQIITKARSPDARVDESIVLMMKLAEIYFKT